MDRVWGLCGSGLGRKRASMKCQKGSLRSMRKMQTWGKGDTRDDERGSGQKEGAYGKLSSE